MSRSSVDFRAPQLWAVVGALSSTRPTYRALLAGESTDQDLKKKAVYEALNVRVSNPDKEDEWMYSLDDGLDPPFPHFEFAWKQFAKEAHT